MGAMKDTIVYGTHAVEAALASGNRVDRLYVATGTRVRGAAQILARAKSARVPVDRVPLAKLNVIAGSSEHQGVAARISPVELWALPDLIAACPARSVLVVLERVQHSRNLGLIARTALAAGASGVVVSARGGAAVDETVVRSSAGAALRMPIAMAGNVPQALRHIRDAGFWIYGLDAAGRDDVFSVAWADRAALVVGNESTGLRDAARNACDTLVRVPMTTDTESLNAAVAASVAVYQAAASLKIGPFSRDGV
jgi:23S rRNA (guanosine2251-2'-O)-methyltransferase